MELTPSNERLAMCDTSEEFASVCDVVWAETDEAASKVPLRLYGDLFLCASCTREIRKTAPVNPRCPQCGYWNEQREAGDAHAPCGEPCL